MKRYVPWVLLVVAVLGCGYEFLAPVMPWPLVAVISVTADVVILKGLIVAASAWCCSSEMRRDLVEQVAK